MNGHVRKRGKGWVAVVSVGRNAETGRYDQIWTRQVTTKRDAERLLTGLMEQAYSGSLIKTPARLTVDEFLGQWLRDYAASNVRPRTFQGYTTIIECHLIPELGNIPLSQLRPAQIQAYYANMLIEGRRDRRPGGLSARTVHHHHRILSEVMSTAVRWGIIGRNPCQHVDPPWPAKRDIRTLDGHTIPPLLEAFKDTPYHPIVHLAIFTGMRRSEILGLRWGDLDLDRGAARVSQTLLQVQGKFLMFSEPKSAKARRMIALPPSSVLMLRAHRERQEADAESVGGQVPTGDALVFCHAYGSPILPDTVTHAFARIALRAGLGGIRFHDLRHSHASLMLRRGIHPKIVSERLGHASISLTLDTYSHVLPGLQEAAALDFEQSIVDAQGRAEKPVVGLQ